MYARAHFRTLRDARGGVQVHTSAYLSAALNSHDIEGLLQLSGQSVLQQLLGGQRLQELVEGLSRCKQQLGDKLQSQNVWYL